jgi:hypothetical protein
MMKIMKWSSILLLSVFFMWTFMPHANAKHHRKSRTSFGLSFNVAPARSYVAVAPAPVIAPAPIVAPAPVAVMPYRSYVAGPVYPYAGYSYYNAPVYVEHRAPRAYVQPSFSYSYWRY